MIRLAVMSLWCSALTLGSASFVLNDTESSANDHVGGSASLEQFDTELLAVPVITNGNLTGYTLIRLSLVFDAAGREKVTLPMELVVSDAYNAFMSGNTDFAFPRIKNFDYDAFTNGFKTHVNASLGDDLVKDVLIGQVDHFASSDVRARSAARRAQLRDEGDQ